MLPLEPETEPLSACPRCARRVSPPLGPSFVYGVGAIGFQHCPACGARWRCLWPTARTRRRVPLRTAALVGAAAIAVGVGVAAYASTRGAKGPELAAATRGAGARRPAPGPVTPAAARYLAIAEPSNAARTELMQFLNAAPPATPVADLEQHIAVYVAAARRADTALTAGRWPAASAPAIQQLVTADRTLANDLGRGVGRLNLRWFGDRLEAHAASVRAAAARVRVALGVPAIAPLSDPRFALL